MTRLTWTACSSLSVAAAAALAVWAALDPQGVDWGDVTFVWAGALVLASGVAVYGLALRRPGTLAGRRPLRSGHGQPGALRLAAQRQAGYLHRAHLGRRPGRGPGFMVGATTALVSNFFFGQGPWTPWQMLAWGAVGGVRAACWAAAVRIPAPLGPRRRRALCAFAFDWTVTVWMFVAFSAHMAGPARALRARAALRPRTRRCHRSVRRCFWPSGC